MTSNNRKGCGHMTPDLSRAKWRKSSRSNGQGSCVEVANTLGAMRDSKNPDGPVLDTDLAGLIAAVKANRFHR